MTHLSDKQLLKSMSEFPDYELTEEERNKVLVAIRKHQVKEKNGKISWRKISVLCALLAILIIAPLLYLGNISDKKELSYENSVQVVGEGIYFALKDKSGNSVYGDYNYGIPDKVSLLRPHEWIAEDYRSVSKLMIFLWGNPQDLIHKNLKVIGVHTETGFEQELTNVQLSGNLHNEDAHALLRFAPFSKAGIWNLIFLVEGEKHAEFSIYVKEPYIQVGNSTLLISQEDLLAGFYENAAIDVIGDSLPNQLQVELVNLKNNERRTFMFTDKADFISANTMQKASMYTGDFSIDKSGKYQLKILNQTATIEVRKPHDAKSKK